MREYYFENNLEEFVIVCKVAGLDGNQIRNVLNHSISSTPKTWKHSTARMYGDVVGNWFAKELNRKGSANGDSERRRNLYKQRELLINHKDMKLLRERAPSFCHISGHPINYGLGLTKVIYEDYFTKKYGLSGISPSIERINPDLGYTIDNIEIISSFENQGRNLDVNTDQMRNVLDFYKKCADQVPSQIELLRLLQVGKCKVSFEKIDGSIRTMTATLDLNKIPEDKHPRGDKKTGVHVINAWDIDCGEWRSFVYDRIKRVDIV